MLQNGIPLVRASKAYSSLKLLRMSVMPATSQILVPEGLEIIALVSYQLSQEFFADSAVEARPESPEIY